MNLPPCLSARRWIPAVAAVALSLAAARPALHAADEPGIPITSDSAEFDLKNGVFHYRGHVRVDAPGILQLTCDDLVANIPGGAGKLDNLVAQGHVVIEVARANTNPEKPALKIVATSEKAVYVSAKESVTLTGSPRVETPQATTIGESATSITYNLVTGQIAADGPQRTLINPKAFAGSRLFGARTNAPAENK